MTQVSWKRQLALAFALVVLGTFAYWLQYKHKPKVDEQEEQSKKIFALKDTPVESVKIRANGLTFEMTCSDLGAKLCKPGDTSKWELKSPTKLRADDANVNSLLSSMNNLNITETIDLKDETPQKREALLKEYGLDPASLASDATKKIYVTTSSGELVLYLGLTHPIGESLFGVVEHVAKGQEPTMKAPSLDENKVYLVPTYFKANLEHNLTYWRDKKLLSLSSHEVESFKLDGTKAHLVGERKNGDWILHSTVGGSQEEFPGDIENIDNALTGAAFLTAKDFTSDNKNDKTAAAALKGSKKVLTLTLQKEKGAADKEAPAPVTLTLFAKGLGKDGKAKQLYATVSTLDPLFELEPYSLDRLDKEAKDLRLTKLITSMDRFTAKKIEFSGKPMGSTPLAFANTDGKWLTDPGKAEFNSEKLQSFLDKLTGNRIREFLTAKSIPTGEGDGLIFTLGDDKSPAKRKLVFWKVDSKVYARDLLSGKKEAFLIDPSIQSDIPWDRAFFDKQAAPSPGATPPHAPMPSVKK